MHTHQGLEPTMVTHGLPHITQPVRCSGGWERSACVLGGWCFRTHAAVVLGLVNVEDRHLAVVVE